MPGVHISHISMLWEISVFLTTLRLCYRGFVMPNLYLAFEFNSTCLQGTKVLEDREIRLRFCSVSEDAPPQHISLRIVKYTGTLVSPQWEDVEPGRVFTLPRYFVQALRHQKPSSKRYAMSRLTSPPRRVRQNSTRMGKRATGGTIT